MQIHINQWIFQQVSYVDTTPHPHCRTVGILAPIDHLQREKGQLESVLHGAAMDINGLKSYLHWSPNLSTLGSCKWKYLWFGGITLRDWRDAADGRNPKDVWGLLDICFLSRRSKLCSNLWRLQSCFMLGRQEIIQWPYVFGWSIAIVTPRSSRDVTLQQEPQSGEMLCLSTI